MSIYTPKSFNQTNVSQLHEFIEKFNFATLITHHIGENYVSHVPILLDRNRGQLGTLIWHVAKINPQADAFPTTKTLCIFHGPHAYISPTWYKMHPSVPTWNYTVVHAEGIAKQTNAEQLEKDLSRLVEHHEKNIELNSPYLIPENYKNKLIEHIVGFHMEITSIQGKFKLGQNRCEEDQQGMLQGLLKQKDDSSHALAHFIQSLKNDP